jgi:hypothetical protein
MPESLQQPLSALMRKGVFPERSGDLYRLPHLLQICAASLTDREMLLEPQPILRAQPALEVISHDLDQLLARELRWRLQSTP